MRYFTNLSIRTQGLWLLIVAALVLPQAFMFIVNSFYQNAWTWDLHGLHDPTTLLGAMLWFPHALMLGLVMYYLAEHREWGSYLLGRVGAVAFAVLAPFAAFTGGWIVYDVGAYDRQYGTGRSSLSESWSFVQNYVLNDMSYWAGFVVTGIAAVLISLWFRPRLFGSTPDALSAAAAQSAHPQIALVDVAGERLGLEEQGQREHRVA